MLHILFMHAHSFPIDLKFRFSQLINDYILEDKKLKSYYPSSEFIDIDYLTEGQASTCLLAESLINQDDELKHIYSTNNFFFPLSKISQN